MEDIQGLFQCNPVKIAAMKNEKSCLSAISDGYIGFVGHILLGISYLLFAFNFLFLIQLLNVPEDKRRMNIELEREIN